MGTKPVLRVSITWMLYNYLLEGLETEVDEYQLAKYEEIFSKPKRGFETIASEMGVESEAGRVLERDKIRLSSKHIGQGNPVRYNRGVEKLEPDTEWIDKMSQVRSKIVFFICKKVLEKYSYL
jgi:hypothetical protein